MLISVEVFEQTKPSKYVLFICVNTWMALFFFAAIPGIINTVMSERWPLSTYLWHFVLLFQCKKMRHLAPHYFAMGGKPGDKEFQLSDCYRLFTWVLQREVVIQYNNKHSFCKFLSWWPLSSKKKTTTITIYFKSMLAFTMLRRLWQSSNNDVIL